MKQSVGNNCTNIYKWLLLGVNQAQYDDYSSSTFLQVMFNYMNVCIEPDSLFSSLSWLHADVVCSALTLNVNIWKEAFHVSQRGKSNAVCSRWVFELTAQMWSHGAGVFNPSCSLLWCKARLLIKPIRSGKKNSPTAVLWSTGSESTEWSSRMRTTPQMGGWQEMINDYWSEAKNNILTHQYYQPHTTQRSPRGIILIISYSNWGEVISATQKSRRLSSAAERHVGLKGCNEH